jgi:glycosyltransferase involved in cell wall biosynthesis
LSREPTNRDANEVTIVAHDIGPIGGMERQLTELVSGLLSRGWKVTVVGRTCHLKHPRLRFVRVPGPGRPFPLAYPWFLLVGSLLTSRHRRGLVHTTGAIVLNRADLSTVHHCHHGSQEKGMKGRMRRASLPFKANAVLARAVARAGERLVLRPKLTGMVVAVSPQIAEEVTRHLGFTLSQVRVVPNGVDSDTFRPDPKIRQAERRTWGVSDRDFVALFVGNEWREKGLKVAIEAVADLPDCRLAVAGDGDIAHFRAIAADHGAGDRILFLGRRADVSRCYAAADAFLLPTAYEAFSLASLEAAASALPLLVTEVNGASELITPDVTGWFISRDDPNDIRRRLGELGSDPERCRRMGAAARSVAERFTWPKVVDEYESLYRALGRSSTGPVKAQQPASLEP